jgi:hypothetical protein
MTVSIVADNGLARFARYLTAAPEIATRAAALALNQISERDAMRILRTGIEEQTEFPPGYVAPRIFVKRKAYNHRLETVLAARHRPTSLARFARGQAVGGRRGGVRVTVNPGSTRQLDRAFLIRLRAGKALTDENFNLGLAIRLKPGEKVQGKRVNKEFGGGLTLLYGPSVNQVMVDVADEQSPAILTALDNEFLRQCNRLSERA